MICGVSDNKEYESDAYQKNGCYGAKVLSVLEVIVPHDGEDDSQQREEDDADVEVLFGDI
jgi:hypothetical protein